MCNKTEHTVELFQQDSHVPDGRIRLKDVVVR
jgi:hypothetical protein